MRWLLDLLHGDVTEWHVAGPWFWERAKSITGEELGPLTMRRLVKGRWQYRNMTAAEMREYVSKTAW